LRRREQKREGSHAADIPSSQEDPDTDKEKAAEQDNEDPYPPELLNNLIFRYEEPSTQSRWDKPLFTVLWSDATPPVDDIWTALTGIPVPKSTSAVTPISSVLTSSIASKIPSVSDAASKATGTLTARATLPRPKIKPHQATAPPAATDPAALYTFEKKTSSVISAIRSFTLSQPSAEAALAQGSNPGGITIPVPEASTPVFIPAHVATNSTTDELAGAGGILALPRLQRLRRQWISLNRAYVGLNHGSGKGGVSSDQAGDAFVRYLNAEFVGQMEER
jgi:protein KTI12